MPNKNRCIETKRAVVFTAAHSPETIALLPAASRIDRHGITSNISPYPRILHHAFSRVLRYPFACRFIFRPLSDIRVAAILT
jgi:hypothetical protein